jgi:hypothetical protein
MTKSVSSDDEKNEDLKTLERSLSRWEVVAKLMALATMILAAWLTTKGLFDSTIEAHAANTEGMVTAAMTALVAIVLIGGGTMLLFDLAMQAGRKQRKQVIGLTLAIIPLVFGISTYNAILATSAERSMILDMNDKTAAWQRFVEMSAKEATKAQSAKASLLPLQSSLCTLAAGERKSGLLSGSGGTGAVSAAYSSACSSVGTIIQTLSETSEHSHVVREQAAVMLDALDQIPQNAAITVFERQAQFKKQDRALRKLIGSADAQHITQLVQAQLGILQSSVASLGAEDGAFGQKQKQAVANLKQSLGLVKETVGTLLADGHARITPPKGLLSMDEATFKYIWRNTPRVLIALATDFFSLWLVAFLMVARNMAENRRAEIRAAQHHTQQQ